MLLIFNFPFGCLYFILSVFIRLSSFSFHEQVCERRRPGRRLGLCKVCATVRPQRDADPCATTTNVHDLVESEVRNRAHQELRPQKERRSFEKSGSRTQQKNRYVQRVLKGLHSSRFPADQGRGGGVRYRLS